MVFKEGKYSAGAKYAISGEHASRHSVLPESRNVRRENLRPQVRHLGCGLRSLRDDESPQTFHERQHPKPRLKNHLGKLQKLRNNKILFSFLNKS